MDALTRHHMALLVCRLHQKAGRKVPSHSLRRVHQLEKRAGLDHSHTIEVPVGKYRLVLPGFVVRRRVGDWIHFGNSLKVRGNKIMVKPAKVLEVRSC